MRYRKTSEEVKQEFFRLFSSGLGPAAAYEKFTGEVEQQCTSNNEFLALLSDRSRIPDLPWVYKFFSKKFDEKYDPQGSYEEVIRYLKTFLQDKSDICSFKEVNDDFVIAICTPMMRRLSTLPTAGELLFVDSTGGVARYGFKVFPLIVNTCVGGCPIGVLLTTCETDDVTEEALLQYLTLVGQNSFGGRGSKGPKCIMTDDCKAEVKALQNIFPEASCLLCIFHFLRAVYKWLYASKNEVPKNDRLILYQLTKKMVYARTEEDLVF